MQAACGMQPDGMLGAKMGRTSSTLRPNKPHLGGACGPTSSPFAAASTVVPGRAGTVRSCRPLAPPACPLRSAACAASGAGEPGSGSGFWVGLASRVGVGGRSQVVARALWLM